MVPHRNDGEVYAYPWYDRLATNGDPDRFADGDLLGPTLLNAAPTIRAFRGLREHRQRLEEALQQVRRGVDLADASDVDLRALGALYSVLDSPGVPDVRGTTLA